MNYEEAMQYIHAVQWAGHKPGLSRTRTLLAALGSPHKRLKFVHVAGTNGKGSTAAMLASCLRAAGYCVGLYTSPFINRFNERIQVDGEQIGDEELVRLRSHIAQFRVFLTSTEPVGRKMDFLVQELNREVNTTGSKSQHLEITKLVVDMKSEIEKIREQIQNIE